MGKEDPLGIPLSAPVNSRWIILFLYGREKLEELMNLPLIDFVKRVHCLKDNMKFQARFMHDTDHNHQSIYTFQCRPPQFWVQNLIGSFNCEVY
jgi:hypothetical protein